MSKNGFSPTIKSKIFFKTNGYCAYCGGGLDPFIHWEVEHVVPRSRGGTDEISNLVPSCRWCNRRKRSKSLDEFREYLTQQATDDIDRIINYVENYGIVGQQDELLDLLKQSIRIMMRNKFKFFINSQEQ